MHLGSGLYGTNVLSCVFSLVAKRSISGFVYSCEQLLLNIFSLGFHSVWTSFFWDSRSASVFCIPGMCVAESQFSFSCAHFQICLVKVLHFPEWLVPNLFIQATAVELSHSIFMWVNRMWRARDFKPNSIVLSFKTLIWFYVSSSEKSPPIELEPITAPQPLKEALVFISIEGLGTIMSL